MQRNSSSIRIERAAAAWLARRDAGPWGPRDQAELDAWLAASIARRVAWIRLETAWRESGRLKALGAGQPPGTLPARGQWASFTDSPQLPPTDSGRLLPPADPAAALVFARRQPASKTPKRAAMGLAALVLAVAGASAWQWRLNHVAQPIVYRTALGGLQAIPLDDGTRATLSSDSRIVVALSRRERRVDMERGEAYFHAAKDPARPFVVTVDGYRAVAVGTRFAVRRDAHGARVVVTEGRVRLEPAPDAGNRHPPVLLTAGSMALADGNGVVVRSGTVAQAELALSWREGFLSFRDTPLAAAAAEFNRYNASKIVVSDPEVASIRIGGNFRSANVEAFVRLLELGFPVRAERHGDQIVLHRR